MPVCYSQISGQRLAGGIACNNKQTIGMHHVILSDRLEIEHRWGISIPSALLLVS